MRDRLRPEWVIGFAGIRTAVHVVLMSALLATGRMEITPMTNLVIQALKGFVPVALGMIFAVRVGSSGRATSSPQPGV